MKLFAKLFRAIDGANNTNEEVLALTAYFSTASPEDKIWTIALSTDKRPKRCINTSTLRLWATQKADLKNWLFEECYRIVGDLAETIALVLPLNTQDQDESLSYWIRYIDSLRSKSEVEKEEAVLSAWSCLDSDGRFLFNKLITGGFRIGVSNKTITKAVAIHLNKDENHIAYRLMQNWDPFNTTFNELLIEENLSEQYSKPFPFYLAYALEEGLEDLGPAIDWYAEWKWGGIRAQLIVRDKQVYLWSRSEEIISDSFPEFKTLNSLDQCSFVIDGELLIRKEEIIHDFNILQKRLGKKKPSKKIIQESPAAIIAFDVLEYNGIDLRDQSLLKRRAILESIVEELPSNAPISLSPLLEFNDWEELIQKRLNARSSYAEGIMLKSKEGKYKTGRKKGEWWKWKLDPHTIDAVMLYAQRAGGRGSKLYTNFTFAVWDQGRLVTFTKAHIGLEDNELKEISAFVKKNTIERFGPVVSVKPELVFEVTFEGIALSKRHKSGISLRFPRIKRWRKDRLPKDANEISDLLSLL